MTRSCSGTLPRSVSFFASVAETIAPRDDRNLAAASPDLPRPTTNVRIFSNLCMADFRESCCGAAPLGRSRPPGQLPQKLEIGPVISALCSRHDLSATPSPLALPRPTLSRIDWETVLAGGKLRS